MKSWNTKNIMVVFVGLLLFTAIVIAILSGLQKGSPERLRQAVILMAIRNYFSEAENFRKLESKDIIGKEVESPTSLLDIPFFDQQTPRRTETADSACKPGSHIYVIVYNPQFSRTESDWIAFVKATDIEARLFGYLTLSNDGEIERRKKTNCLLSDQEDIYYFTYNAHEKLSGDWDDLPTE